MKQNTLLGFATVAIAFGLICTSQPSRGQVGAGGDDPKLIPLITEIAQQQTAIIENQTQIEAKLATVAESVRLARIFVSRGGGGGGASPK